jgi:serine/threonine-protein kinase
MKIVAEPVPNVTTQRPSVPANVAAALAKALERLPADRFDSARAFADALANQTFRTVTAQAADAARSDARSIGGWIRSPLSWAALAIIGAVLSFLVITQGPTRRGAAGVGSAAVVRFAVPVNPDPGRGHVSDAFRHLWATELAISPDGGRLVYVAMGADSGFGLYQRQLDQDKAEVLLAGSTTQQYERPFFSPDGVWVGFVAWGADGVTLRRLRLADGVTETIGSLASFANRTNGTGFTGPTWGDDNSIIIATPAALYTIPASGGEWKRVAETPSDSGLQADWFQPHMLPGSRTVLLHTAPSGRPGDAEIVALDVTTGDRQTVIANAMNPLYLPPGYLLFVREGVLMGVRFDPARAVTSGQPVVLMDDVMQAVGMGLTTQETGAAQAAVSASGSMAYARGGVRQPEQLRAIRVSTRGDTVPIALDRGEWVLFRLSPDAGHLAAVAKHGQRLEMWIHDLTRGVTRSLKSGGYWNWPLEWSPDGRWILFSSDVEQPGRYGLYRMLADGSGRPEQLVPAAAAADANASAGSWSSQGVIAYLSGPLSNIDIWVIPPDSQPRPFVHSDSSDWYPTFSPDGRWLAYASKQSGRFEVYVRPYPGGEPATQVSAGGGDQPIWSRDGRTLFFKSLAGVLMAVDLAPGLEFRPGRVRSLGRSPLSGFFPVRREDIFPDGSFVMAVPDPDAPAQPWGVSELHVILNFATVVAKRVGRGK